MARSNDRRHRSLRPSLEAMEGRVVLTANPSLVGNPFAMQEAAALVATEFHQIENTLVNRYGQGIYGAVDSILSRTDVIVNALENVGLDKSQITWAAVDETLNDMSLADGALADQVVWYGPNGGAQGAIDYGNSGYNSPLLGSNAYQAAS